MKVWTSARNRILTDLTAALLIVFLVFGQTVFAARTPIREVHQVPAGNTMYCFFVEHNVVLTPEEVASFESDKALTKEILQRAVVATAEPDAPESKEIKNG